MAVDLPSAEEGASNEAAVESKDEKEIINLVNGVPRYLLVFGLMCALFCVSFAFIPSSPSSRCTSKLNQSRPDFNGRYDHR